MPNGEAPNPGPGFQHVCSIAGYRAVATGPVSMTVSLRLENSQIPKNVALLVAAFPEGSVKDAIVGQGLDRIASNLALGLAAVGLILVASAGLWPTKTNHTPANLNT